MGRRRLLRPTSGSQTCRQPLALFTPDSLDVGQGLRTRDEDSVDHGHGGLRACVDTTTEALDIQLEVVSA